jgi:hypothetical protein
MKKLITFVIAFTAVIGPLLVQAADSNIKSYDSSIGKLEFYNGF